MIVAFPSRNFGEKKGRVGELGRVGLEHISTL